MDEPAQPSEHVQTSSTDTLPPSAQQSFFESKQFHALVIALMTTLALCPLWLVRFLPLQDYPQHLLLAHMLHTHNNPAFDYNKNFVFHFRPAPYVTFYALVLLFSQFLSPEIAGKVVMSLYVVLVAALAVRLARSSKAYPAASWVPLLLFPFAFNQHYFLGFTNYILSVPLLIFTLRDHERLASGASGVRPVMRHVLWQLALLLSHPFTFLTYVLFAVLGAMLFDRKTPGFKRALLAPLASLLVLSLWFFAMRSTSGTLVNTAFQPLRWFSFARNFNYYAFMFTGMRSLENIETGSALLWALIFLILIGAILAAPREQHIVRKRYLLFFILATLAVFVLPFARYDYTFLNLRFASVSYFLLPVCLVDVRLKSVWKWIFIICVAALMTISAAKQVRISREVEEVLPLVEKIPPNSVILPLVFNNNSAELDPSFFDTHLHVHNYYHIIVGGGLNPFIPSQPIHPVRYKPRAIPPSPPQYSPNQFNWRTYGQYYDYFLLRDPPESAEPLRQIARHAVFVASSGKWLLFKRKP
jgi:hypothetical protein